MITVVFSLSQPVSTQSGNAVPVATNQKIPVLCYHQVRDWNNTDSKNDRTYIVPPAVFKAHMKALHDSGYSAILPDELIAYLKGDICVRYRPVVITFDDGTASQYTNASPVLNEYGFKATFFIMTVTLNKSSYMSDSDIRLLASQGHIIGCHTWDHHRVDRYQERDWVVQLTQPTEQLEEITGKPVRYFAYPYGVWDEAAVDRLKEHRYQAAFQLGGKEDIKDPLFSIRRIVADGHWSVGRLMHEIKNYEQ